MSRAGNLTGPEVVIGVAGIALARGELEMLRGGRWIRTYYGTTGWQGLEAGKARVHTGGGHPDAPGRAPEYNDCVDGRFHAVRITILTSLTRPALNRTEGRRQWRFPVSVHGSCAARRDPRSAFVGCRKKCSVRSSELCGSESAAAKAMPSPISMIVSQVLAGLEHYFHAPGYPARRVL
jgi:hypothetical protein